MVYNPLEFWQQSWRNTPTKHPPKEFYLNIQKILNEYKCENVLEVGCGEAYGAAILENYVGLDFVPFNDKILEYDLAHRIPWLNEDCNSYDAVFSRMTLLHIPPDGIDRAVSNIKRLAKKVIILCEYPHLGSDELWIHCFNHNLREKFKGSNVVFVDAYGNVGDLVYEC